MSKDPLEQVIQAVEKARQEVPQPTQPKRKGGLLRWIIITFGVLAVAGVIVVVIAALGPKGMKSLLPTHPNTPNTPGMTPTVQGTAVSAVATPTMTPTPTERLATPTSGSLSRKTATPPKRPSTPTKRIATPTGHSLLGLIVAERGVNVRAQPNTEAKRVGGLPKDTRVALLARNHDCTWLYVRGKVDDVSVEGWVFARFVQAPKNACSVLRERRP